LVGCAFALRHSRRNALLWSLALRYLADGRWYTLACAANRLGVSPACLRAALREFIRMGAPLQRDAYRGLRFVQAVTPLRAASEHVSLPVDESLTIDSTNTRAMQALGAGLTRPKAWVAEYQTLGRGRAQRRWHQGMGCGLSVSIALPVTCPVSMQALSLRVGLALAEAVKRYGVLDVGLKWPNDLVWQGKKLGGILIETRRAGVVVGIGLNHLRLRHEASAIRQPMTSLQEALGWRLPRRAQVLAELLRRVLHEISTVSDTWQRRYAQFDALLGRTISVSEGESAVWRGVAEGVDAQGYLQVRTAQGLRSCRAGEVSVRVNEHLQGQDQ